MMSQSLDSEDDAADMLPKVTFANMDRDYLANQKRQEDKAALGGMRNPRRAVDKLAKLKATGMIVRKEARNFIQKHPELVDDTIKALGNDRLTGPSQHLVDELRSRLLRVMGAPSSWM